jgi:hypothetical protein
MFYKYPFTYRRDFLQKGGQRVTSRYPVDFVDVDIPEISAGEAPLAATWMHFTESILGREYAPAHVLVHEGRFLAPYTDYWRELGGGFPATALPSAGSSSPLAMASAARLIEHWDVGRFAGPLREWMSDGKMQRPPLPSAVDVDLGGNHGEMEALARKVAEGLVIVSGMVYRTVPEPVFVLETDPSRLSLEIRFRNPAFIPFSAHEVSNLVDHEALSRAARRAAGERHLVATSDRVEVLVPEAFSFHAGENARARVLGQMIRAYENVPVAAWPRVGVEGFLDLRDRFRAYADDNGCVDIELLLRQAMEFFSRQEGILDGRFVEFVRNARAVADLPIRIDIDRIAGETSAAPALR